MPALVYVQCLKSHEQLLEGGNMGIQDFQETCGKILDLSMSAFCVLDTAFRFLVSLLRS